MKQYFKLMSNRKKKWSIMKQFLKFGIVGVSNTLISLLIYYILIYFDIDYVVANAIGFIVGVLNSYYWNNKYVFDKSHSGNIKPIIKTFLSYGLTFILSTILLVVMVDFFIFSKVVAPIINLIITIPLNFLLNKFWAFR